MNLSDLTEGQRRILQGQCLTHFDNIPPQILVTETKEQLYKEAFSRGAQAVLSMFSTKLQLTESNVAT